MLEQLRTIVTAVNTRLVLAGAALAVLIDELAPVADLHPAIAWIVRGAGVAIVVLATASRILRRSTEVPEQLRGLRPEGAQNARWAAWDGGQFRYTAPMVFKGDRPSNGPARPPQGSPPPTTAA